MKRLLLMQQEDQIVKQILGKIIRYHRKIIMYSNLWIKGTLMIFSIVNVGQMVWCSCRAVVHKETIASTTYKMVEKAIPPCAHLFSDFFLING